MSFLRMKKRTAAPQRIIGPKPKTTSAALEP